MNMTVRRPAAPDYPTKASSPTDHPLWETQVNLERGMMRDGADKVRDAVLMAEKRGQMTRVGVVRGLLAEWLPPVAEAVRGWVRGVEAAKGGPKPIAYAYIKEMDPYVAALAGLKTILDNLGGRESKLVGLASRIGRTLEHEQQVRLWEQNEPDLFHHYKDEMDAHKSTGVHRRKVNIHKFNDLVRDPSVNLVWTDWTAEIHFRVGAAIIDLIMKRTGWFELQPDPEHVYRRGRHNTPQYVVAPTKGLKEWLGRAMDNAELNSPVFNPTVIPPRRWTDTKQGGYWTPYVKPPRLVRFKTHQETQRKHAAAEYDAIDMPKVYDAIHVLQETAWRVNKRVLDVAVEAWALDRGIGGLPEVGDRELPPRTPRMVERREYERAFKETHGANVIPPKMDDETQAEIIAWKRKATGIHRHNAKRFSRMKATSATILCAQSYVEYERVYFPHMLDFRGRIYPIPNALSPQGNDLSRGLLTFADGLPLTEENGGGWWLAVHLANCWGNDKVGFEERVKWVEENEVMFRLIAEDPLAHMEWSDSDKPFQALAAIFEWVDFLNTGFGYVSHLPVMVDGTCNGIQHLSAILRDEVAGEYVNLVPGETPRDIYKFVAEELQADLREIACVGGEEAEHAQWWLDVCGGGFPRSLTKRQVMVLPYGGTLSSFFTYSRDWLDENHPVPPEGLDEAGRELRSTRVTFLAGRMWEVVHRVVQAGMTVMAWLQGCVKALRDIDAPLRWQTPSGFSVIHFYGRNDTRKCELMVDGTRLQLTRLERGSKLSIKDQLKGVAPNFIHSLDASALVLCLERCRTAGIEDISAIHDAYGTHAANMEPLSVFLREAFVEVHRVDVLGGFRAACRIMLAGHLTTVEKLPSEEAEARADAALPPPLSHGRLSLEAVLQSAYFFA